MHSGHTHARTCTHTVGRHFNASLDSAPRELQACCFLEHMLWGATLHLKHTTRGHTYQNAIVITW